MTASGSRSSVSAEVMIVIAIHPLAVPNASIT